MNSKTMVLAVSALSVVCAGCLLESRHHGETVYLAPPLPTVVMLDTEPYYVQEGYHYHYRDDGWYYSRSRSGPWSSLPRDRYPREVRYKNKNGDPGRGPGQKPGHQGR